MVDQNCAYCVEGDLVAKFGIKICELETSGAESSWKMYRST